MNYYLKIKQNQKFDKLKRPLPFKECIVCKRPFSWRKKWEKVWDDVKYCSKRCRSNKKIIK